MVTVLVTKAESTEVAASPEVVESTEAAASTVVATSSGVAVSFSNLTSSPAHPENAASHQVAE